MIEKVQDSRGHEWTIRRPFAPWWRIIQPANTLMGQYESQQVELPLGPARAQTPDSGMTKKDVAIGVAVAPLMIAAAPFLIAEPLAWLFLRLMMVLVLPPLALVEIFAQGVAGSTLWALRRMGWAGHRVEVLCRTGHRTHSRTVLLLRGPRTAADALVRELAERIAGSEKRFRPVRLPEGVVVLEYRSAWNPKHLR